MASKYAVNDELTPLDIATDKLHGILTNRFKEEHRRLSADNEEGLWYAINYMLFSGKPENEVKTWCESVCLDNMNEVKIFSNQNGYIIENEEKHLIKAFVDAVHNLDGIISDYHDITFITYYDEYIIIKGHHITGDYITRETSKKGREGAIEYAKKLLR